MKSTGLARQLSSFPRREMCALLAYPDNSGGVENGRI